MATKYGGLDETLAAEIESVVFEQEGFMRLTQVIRYGGKTSKTGLRPVVLKTGKVWQVESSGADGLQVTNIENDAARELLAEILGHSGSSDIHIQTAQGDVHVRITRKGRVLVSRSKPLQREVTEAMPHDREKQQPLGTFDADILLRGVGIADGDGRIKASMRGKYDQINAFLRIVDATLGSAIPEPLNIVDYGCGKAYLTFAVYFYLTQSRKASVRVCGIDRNSKVIASARKMALNLGVSDEVSFVEGEIGAELLELRPTLALSLHACDTDTDAAIAAAIEAKSRYILCAPCCQHELHKSLQGGGAMRAVLRHGIMRERLADLLTDTFRAQLLRIAGYRVRVVEFVDQGATAKNIMLRAEAGIAPRQAEAVEEYLALRDLWGVVPWLESKLGGEAFFS